MAHSTTPPPPATTATTPLVGGVVDVDALVRGLRRARYKMYNMRSDGRCMKRRSSRMLSPTDTVRYFDRCFQLGGVGASSDVEEQPGKEEGGSGGRDIKRDADEQHALLLFDLANVPLSMVLAKRQRSMVDDM